MTDGPIQPTPDTRGDSDRDTARLLDVDHLESDIVTRSIRSGGVTLAAQAVKVLVQSVAIVVLARLLAPADFGVFAMVAVFLSLLELFKDLGLSAATVQSANVTLRQVSTLFWLNALLGVVIAASFALAGPLLAWGYGEAQLSAIAPVVAVAFVFTGLSAQHLALLRRQMRFADVARIQVGADIVSLVAAVAAAATGLGVWALIVQRIVWAVALAAGSWLICRWIPGRPGPLKEVRAFLSFGGNATASMSVSYLSGNLDKVLIGWQWGATALGFYDRAQRLQMLPIQNLNIPLGNVALSTLSRLVHQPDAYRRMYRAAVERLAMVVAPLGGLLVAGAEPLVFLILGPQWTGTAPILAWLGVAMAYLPVSSAVSWLFMSQDRTREMLRSGLLNSLLTVAAILGGLPFGPEGVAASLVVTAITVRVPWVFWFAGRRGPVRTRDLWTALTMPAAGECAAALAVWATRASGEIHALPLVAQVSLLCVAAVAAALATYMAFPSGRQALLSLCRLTWIIVPGRTKAATGSPSGGA
jgi:PST family polysaccharide transporter